MNKEEIKGLIVRYVVEKQGCKCIGLATNKDIVLACKDFNFSLLDLIDELIDEEKLIDIEYILPDIDYRVKSFLLPGKTKLVRHILRERKNRGVV